MKYTVNYNREFGGGNGIYAIAHDMPMPNAIADMCSIGSPLRGKLIVGMEYGKLLLVDESNGWIQPKLWTLDLENRMMSEIFDFSLLAYANVSVSYGGPSAYDKGVIRHLDGNVDWWYAPNEGDMVIDNMETWRFTYEFRDLMHQLDGVYSGPTNSTDVIRIKDTAGNLAIIEDDPNKDILIFKLIDSAGNSSRISLSHFFGLFLE